MPPIATSCARLLYQSQASQNIIPSQLYQPTSLLDDIHRLSDVRAAISDGAILNILLKYFHAYIHPGSQAKIIGLKEINCTFNQFAMRRKGCHSLEGKPELRKFLVSHSFALCMLADIPKTAQIFKEIISQQLDWPQADNIYHGLDIGSGTGILMLAQWIQAKRHKYKNINICGLERENAVYKQTQKLASILEIGNLVQADAAKAENYIRLCPTAPTFIANETIPAPGHRMWKEDFLRINQALFTALGPQLKQTKFFPSALYVASRDGKIIQKLSPQNQFDSKRGYPMRLMFPTAINIAGKVVPLQNIGNNFNHYISPQWRTRLSNRW